MLPIARVYQTEQKAREAERLLLEDGFRADSIFVVTPAAEDAIGEPKSLATAVLAGFTLREHAYVYANELSKGHALVVVNVPFGAGGAASVILDSCDPLPIELPVEEAEETDWNEATPLSAALRMPVLIRGQPAPLADYLGISSLSSGPSFISRCFGELTSSNFRLASVFGMQSFFGLGLLTNNPTPLSSMLGMKTLSTGKSGDSWSTSMGFPLLSRGPAPLSSMLGLPLLSRNPAPLSKLIGFPALSDHR